MNDMIGILGYHGMVGSEVMKDLAGRFPLRLGARAQREGELLPEDAAFCPVDADREEDLLRFCAGCRVVIDCTAPSYFHAPAVALAAQRSGADLVNPFGPNLFDIRDQFTDITVIPGTGINPGLSGILPVWLAQQFPEAAVKRINICCGGLETLTPAYCTDLLTINLTQFGRMDTYYFRGEKVTDLAGTVPSPAAFPKGTVLRPILTKEMAAAAESAHIVELHRYAAEPGQAFHDAVEEGIRSVVGHPTRENIAQAGQRIYETLIASRKDQENWFQVYLEAEISRDGESFRTIHGWKVTDVTAVISRITTRCAEILYREKHEPGLFWPFRVLPAEETMSRLYADGLFVRTE